MDQQKAKLERRLRRHRHVRKSVYGTGARPRLSVYRSLQNIYCQLINDDDGITMLSVSTLSPEVREQIAYGGNSASAKAVGKVLAEKARSQGITQVVMDRGGFKYHGRIASLANAAREAGLKV